MKSPRFLSLLFSSGILCLAASAQDHPSLPTPGLVRADSLIPEDQRVTPMPRAERIRQNLVPRRGMCSTIPASSAEDGLFSGNGTMNIAVYGQPFAEQVLFNEEDIVQPWKAGKPMEAPKIAYVLPEVRKLMREEKYKEALDLSLDASAKAGLPQGMGHPQSHPAFDLRINTSGRHAVRDYLRTLDFETGEAKVTWTDKEGSWERRSFASRPDNVVVQIITAPAGSSVNVDLLIDTSMILRPPARQGTATPTVPRPYQQHAVFLQAGAQEIHFARKIAIKANSADLRIDGRYVVDAGNPGYAGVTRVVATGGELSATSDTLHIRGARSVLLITRIEVYPEITAAAIEALQHAVDEITPDYDTLLGRHRLKQAEVIDRTSVDFGGSEFHTMSGEEMLIDQRTRQGYNPALLENLFDMGRYWLYARSGRFSPIWGHINVNINLQQSEAAMANLPEATDAFVRWIESLLPDSRTNAQNIFGARGVLFAAHPIQTGGQLEHFEYTWPHHYWISGAGWVYSPIWDYYLVSGDQQFLREHLLPGLKEIALFYEDYLKDVDAQGYYMFLPSYSPENWPANSEGSPAVINSVMDISVCREVLTHLIEGAQILGTDAESIPKWQAMLAKLPPYDLNRDGSLKEWAWPSLEDNLDHRHDSHLYGAWPADEITPELTPELARAAWLAARKRAQGNASAHGMLHRSLVAARLKDPWLVNFDLKQILEQGYVNPSLTTNHNPYTIPSPDPQGAIPTILMESLLYSRPGVIELLPALPLSLRKGTMKGILCRSYAKIDQFDWDLDRKELALTIDSRVPQTLSLVVRRGIESAVADQPEVLGSFEAGADSVSVHLAAGHPVTLRLRVGDKLPSDWITGN